MAIAPLKSIHTVHLQSHEDVFIELPRTGIVAFTGNNSNGKSVIIKVLNAILSNAISRPKERRTLINRKHVSGYIELVRYDDVKLLVSIHTEAAQTYAEYSEPNKVPVRRYLADKSISDLLTLFGLHYDKDSEISLNIHNDDDKFLFVNTKHTVNYTAMNSAISDEVSEMVLNQIESVTTDIKAREKTFNDTLAKNRAIKDALVVYDVEKYTELEKKLTYIAVNIQHIPTSPCPKVKGVPQVETLNIPGPVKRLKYPLILDIPEFPTTNIVQLGRDVNDVLKGVCPTCKRAFFS